LHDSAGEIGHIRGKGASEPSTLNTPVVAHLVRPELDAVVDRLARNIAALPEGVIAAAKCAIVPDDLAEGLLREHDAWAAQIVRPAAEQLIRGGLAHGAQTRDGERDLEGLLRGLAG
jgi:hypothetical protein